MDIWKDILHVSVYASTSSYSSCDADADGDTDADTDAIHCLKAVAGSEHMFLFTLELKDQLESLYLTEVTLCDDHVFWLRISEPKKSK